jgi:hypothetical protein
MVAASTAASSAPTPSIGMTPPGMNGGPLPRDEQHERIRNRREADNPPR